MSWWDLDHDVNRVALGNKHPRDVIWQMHAVQGLAPSEIGLRLCKPTDEVREHICKLWEEDKQRAFRGRC